MKKYLTVLLVTASLFLLTSSSVFACACCAETGTYSINTAKPDSYHLDLLHQMKFGKTADLYMTEAEFDDIKGLGDLKREYSSTGWTAESGEFILSGALSAKTWRFNLTTKSGTKGSLLLPMPVQMLSFKADIHDDSDKGLGPSLYKEFRFKGSVGSGTGFFKSGIDRGTTYFLVFQGRGNNCDNAEDFTHWRLEISGTKANYAFFGDMNLQ